ncbi:Putative NmrA-like domain, NAD(P)-binding domain superfamily [Septoria linicola]|uniref:NmrA-like domain, NAD(P)-binding domain superfamily n=1 Tax=Septoria linicola TaxID=215465 RepID=A0A9Q9EP41_9PEZI|nr:Putative NmrA-like domain, NAD(P)-binding domain superfamily [Septoria linicola]
MSTHTVPNGIHAVLILGDNRLATSIISSLVHGTDTEARYALHQAVHQQSLASATADLTIHPCDFSAGSLATLFGQIKPDVLFSTFSGGSLETQRTIIDAAVSSGIKRFVPSEFGQDSQNAALQERLPPLKGRSQVIDYLKELSKGDKIEWVAAATGTQLDQALISGNIGFDFKWQSVTIHGTGKEQFAASSTNWNGAVATGILRHWEQVKNQYLYASGLVTSANACLDALQTATGQNWETGTNDVEDMVREGQQRIDRGFPDAGMFLLEKSVLCDESLGAMKPFQQQDAKEKLGLSGEDLASLVKRTVHDFKHHGKGDCGCG